MREITIATSALAALLEYLPDLVEPEHVSPGGPGVRRWEWALLNPQPLPPRVALLGEYLRLGSSEWGSRPNPQLWASTIRAVINAHLDQLAMAGIIIVSGDTDDPVRVISESLSLLVDDLCGTPPRKGPFPKPWGPLLDSDTLHPANLVVAGTQFQKAADALEGTPLHDALDQAAEQLLTEGVRRLG